MRRSFGFVVAGTGPVREPDLGTTEGLEKHSAIHGALATVAAVVERGRLPGSPKQEVRIGDDGLVRRVADDPKPTKKEINAQLARRDALRELSGPGQWFVWLTRIVGEDRAIEIAEKLGEPRLRQLMLTPKRERRDELERLLTEHGNG